MSRKRSATLTAPDDGEAVAVVVTDEPDRFKGKLKRLGGSDSDAFNSVVVHQAINSAWFTHADAEKKEKLINASADAMAGIRPRDEIEGMLAAQMIATHNASMECFRRAMLPDQPYQGRESNLNHAGKMVRSYATLIQALDKHRGKGQQTVRVEHVHVEKGGQAVFGAVANGYWAEDGNAAQQSVGLLEKASDEPMAFDLAKLSEAVFGPGVVRKDDE